MECFDMIEMLHEAGDNGAPSEKKTLWLKL